MFTSRKLFSASFTISAVAASVPLTAPRTKERRKASAGVRRLGREPAGHAVILHQLGQDAARQHALRRIGDVQRGKVRPRGAQHLAQRARRAHRAGAFQQDEVVLGQHGRDRTRRVHHVIEHRRPALAERRRHRDHEDLRRNWFGMDREAAIAQGRGEQGRHLRLRDMRGPGRQGGAHARIAVHALDVMAEAGQQQGGWQPDITQAEDGDAHGCILAPHPAQVFPLRTRRAKLRRKDHVSRIRECPTPPCVPPWTPRPSSPPPASST
jgi:hypothetical protein